MHNRRCQSRGGMDRALPHQICQCLPGGVCRTQRAYLWQRPDIRRFPPPREKCSPPKPAAYSQVQPHCRHHLRSPKQSAHTWLRRSHGEHLRALGQEVRRSEAAAHGGVPAQVYWPWRLLWSADPVWYPRVCYDWHRKWAQCVPEWHASSVCLSFVKPCSFWLICI